MCLNEHKQAQERPRVHNGGVAQLRPFVQYCCVHVRPCVVCLNDFAECVRQGRSRTKKKNSSIVYLARDTRCFFKQFTLERTSGPLSTSGRETSETVGGGREASPPTAHAAHNKKTLKPMGPKG